MAKITYDEKINALNIKLKEGKVSDSDIQKNCVIDYDKDGQVLNIEVLDINIEEKLLRDKLQR
ncbi:DUF2283 domain-containing protein [Candidatus Gracilibacteria bacterium]|nr:DUF2283 domain-containing protein [Candidatus Gracilibacteria bacterium]